MTACARPLGALKLMALTVLAGLLAMLGMAAIGASPAHAAARVDVSPAPNVDGSTTVTLTGSGFQYLPNAPGGIYVTFGVVQDPATNSWAPSQGGRSGSTFGYASTGGATLLVAFAGGSSAGESNAVIDANGSWTAQMTIPGARFPSSSGNPHAGQAQEGAEIDCLQVQCGVITFGAHGAVNANNESFTPVGFVTQSGEVVSGSGGQTFNDDATQLEIPGAESGTGDGDGSGGAAEQADEDQPAAGAETESADAGSQAAPEAAAAQQQGGMSSSALVIGVLGFAVLVLIAALVYVAVKRRGAAQAAAGAGAGAAAGASTAASGEAPPQTQNDPIDEQEAAK